MKFSGIHLRKLLTALFLAGCAASPASGDIPEFFAEMFGEYAAEYTALRQPEFDNLCLAHGLDRSNPSNQDTFSRINFLHDLLTTRSASNGARGGFLGIPYFWHWVEPNPRHFILALPDSVLLTTVRTRTPYENYATFADIDRVPALYLADLVADAPGYSHPDCGSFYTFGWCSEREMAFTALLAAWGFRSKIWQSGIHTFSVVWCELISDDGSTTILEVEVDNTFDSVSWREVSPPTSPDHWLADTGRGAQIDWYNRKARASSQINSLKEIPVGDAARARFRSLIQRGLSLGR